MLDQPGCLPRCLRPGCWSRRPPGPGQIRVWDLQEVSLYFSESPTSFFLLETTSRSSPIRCLNYGQFHCSLLVQKASTAVVVVLVAGYCCVGGMHVLVLFGNSSQLLFSPSKGPSPTVKPPGQKVSAGFCPHFLSHHDVASYGIICIPPFILIKVPCFDNFNTSSSIAPSPL